jgi:single-strand DNA-binding protein
MPALNKVQLIGRLGKEPEMRYTPKGTPVTSYSLAVDRVWKGNKDTDWFNIEAWGKLGEVCQKYLQKGQLVYIEGSLRTTKYEHEGETRYFTKVVARSMQMLEWKNKEEEPPATAVEEPAEDEAD